MESDSKNAGKKGRMWKKRRKEIGEEVRWNGLCAAAVLRNGCQRNCVLQFESRLSPSRVFPNAGDLTARRREYQRHYEEMVSDPCFYQWGHQNTVRGSSKKRKSAFAVG